MNSVCCNSTCREGRDCPIRAAVRLNALAMDTRAQYDAEVAGGGDPAYPLWIHDVDIVVKAIIKAQEPEPGKDVNTDCKSFFRKLFKEKYMIRATIALLTAFAVMYLISRPVRASDLELPPLINQVTRTVEGEQKEHIIYASTDKGRLYNAEPSVFDKPAVQPTVSRWFSSMSDVDAYRQAAITALLAVDHHQTQQLRQLVDAGAKPWEHREGNPYLRQNFNEVRVRNYFVGLAVGSAVVTKALPPEWRPAYQYGVILYHTAVVLRNKRFGLSIRF